MKTILLHFRKNSVFVLLITLFCFASCSKKTAYISQQQDLAYQQTVAPNVTGAVEQNNTAIAQVENNTNNIESPKTIESKTITADKVIASKKHRNAFASVNSIKEKAPKVLKNLKAENLAGVTLLASATKGKTKAMMDGKLKLGIILILIGALLSLIPGLGWIGWIVSVVGVVFLILWLIDYL